MKKKLIAIGVTLSLLAVSLTAAIFAVQKTSDNPVEAATYSRNQATYYTSAFSHKVTTSSYGTTLLNTLHELMYDSHQTYNSYDELWTYTKDTDYDIDNPDYITLLYSRQSIDATPTASSWNREHVWCKSLSGGLYTTENLKSSTRNAGSDLHHLRPASTAYNSTRGNTPYGIVTNHTSSTKMGDTDCYSYNNVFEPADYIKGDIARILMYMYTHYSTEVSGTSTKSGALSITNIVSKSTNQEAWDLLMDWNESDPVDYQEMIRNNNCAYLLGNFNPFIDHPEYARMIWDDASSYQAGLCFQTSYKTVSVGSSYSNTASPYGNVSSSDSVVYTSDNPDVATVNSSGTVTGVSNGVARIKARTTINGISKISYHFVVVGSGYTPKYTNNASGIVYTPTSATSARASETIGSETVTFENTYTTGKYHTQMSSGNSCKMTINNFPKTIKSIILSMHSNQSSGTGSISITVGGSSYSSKSGTFSSMAGAYSQSYVPIDMTNSSASKKTGTIVISISSTNGSLFFEKAIVDYTERSVTKATSISVSPNSATLTPGEDAILTTSFAPSTTTLQTVTWSSSNTNVATVTKYGLVRAIANGSATITATANDGSGKTGTSLITVQSSIDGGDEDDPIAVTGVSLDKTSITLEEGETETLSATISPANATNQGISWSSSNSSIATVSSGVVTAVSEGSATITVTTDDGHKTATCSVTVTAGSGSGGDESGTEEGSVSASNGALPEWTLSGAGSAYADGAVKLDSAGDYVEKTNIFSGNVSNNMTSLTVTINGKINGSDSASNSYKVEALDKNGNVLASSPFTGQYGTSYTDKAFTLNSNLHGCTGIRFTYVTKSSGNFGIKKISWSVVYESQTPVDPTEITATANKAFYVGESIYKSDITVTDNLGSTITDFIFEDDGYMFTYEDTGTGGYSSTDKEFAISYNDLHTTLVVEVLRYWYEKPASSEKTISDFSDITETSYSTAGNFEVTPSGDDVAYYAKNVYNYNDTLAFPYEKVSDGVYKTTSEFYNTTPFDTSIVSVDVTMKTGTNQITTKPTVYYSDDGSKWVETNSGNSHYFLLKYPGTFGFGYINIQKITVTLAGEETAENVANYIMYEDVDGQCVDKLDTAIGLFYNMSKSERAAFMTATEQSNYVLYKAHERLEAWLLNQGKTISYDSESNDYVVSQLNNILMQTGTVSEDVLFTILLMSVLSITTFACYIIIKKKKQKQ